jgi:alkylhydroperoxidase family enzyme
VTPRLEPIPPKAWPPEMRSALAPLSSTNAGPDAPARPADRPKGLNVLGLFAHHPQLAQAYNTFNGYLLYGSTLSPRQRELLVLRVSTRRDCEYEWLQHKVAATDLGMPAEQIDRVSDGPDLDGWSPADAALIRAVDELVADARISDETYAVLADHLDPRQLLDLVFTVGAYDLMAMFMRTCGVEVDDDLARWR